MLEYLLMVAMTLLWAAGFVASKLSVASVSPEVVAFLRFLIAGAVMAGIMAIWQRQHLRLRPGDLLLVLGLGATGIAAYNLFFFWGVRVAYASDGAMIIPTLNPLITMFLAAVLLGEPLTRRKLAGAAISLVGQVMIFRGLLQAAANDPGRLLGALLFVGAALCWSSYTILGRVAARRFPPLAATTWGTLSGMLLLTPFALWAMQKPQGYTAPFWGQILYIALGGTVAGFFLWSRGVDRLGASRAAVFLNLVPVSTLLLAFLVLDERPSALQAAGMVIVLGGVYVAGTLPAGGGQPARLR